MRYFLCLIILASSCLALKTPSNLIDESSLIIPLTSPTHMGIDAVGNFYVVQSNRLLIKYSESGEKLITYDEQALGIISSLSCHNPLYIMLHYLESKTIIFMDRNLAVLQFINYGDWTEDDVTSAEIANDNNIWLYNNTRRRLQKYNLEGVLLLESFDLYGLSQKSLYIDQIVEHNNQVYLKNIEGNVIILNNLTGYIKDYSSRIASDLSVSIEGVHAIEDGEMGLNIFNEIEKKKVKIDLLPASFSIFNGTLYGTFDNGIARLN
jgi:hypothetical protein